MIRRAIAPFVKKAAKSFPLIGILGPRQSGKTTLARHLFPRYRYVNLELPSSRAFAREDPEKFLHQYAKFVIIDEAQRVPELFSYLQVKTDQDKLSGQYILTGSQHFPLLSSVSQSLAGRIALFTLYPLSLAELQANRLAPGTLQELIFQGGYPRLYDKKPALNLWFNSYLQTYLERDISQLGQVDNLPLFEKFLRLSAGRTGQLLNLSSLAADVGTAANTIRSWLNLLVVSGLIKLLQPYHANLNKRLIKTPKLYFLDTGLACHLIGLTQKEQLLTHPLYGPLFETLIVGERWKDLNNRQDYAPLYFFRSRSGLEADLVLEQGKTINLAEIKAAETIPAKPFANLLKIKDWLKKPVRLELVYGGRENQERKDGRITSML